MTDSTLAARVARDLDLAKEALAAGERTVADICLRSAKRTTRGVRSKAARQMLAAARRDLERSVAA